jgi:putative Ca2+/H+ antiporter (TMEM165/GDT1 family)
LTGTALFELSLAAFTASFALILLAEMGDKTQFLAMSMASKYNVYKVILGIFLAIAVNFALTVAIGQILTTILPIDVISLAASVSFIAFGLWTIRGEKSKVENQKVSRFGITATVALTFFIAEFGDKTELATISLTAQYQSAVSIFIGAVLAMLVADGIGIVIGVVLCKRIPERILKWISATIFVLFGLIGVYEVLPAKIGLSYTALVLSILTVFSVSAVLILVRKTKNEFHFAKKGSM